MSTLSRRRRRRLLRFAAPLVVVVVLIIVAAMVLTGRLVVPGLSGKVYPIKYESEIAVAADKYHIDPYLLAAMARTESGFDPEAESRVGALGLMQLLPRTAEWVTTLNGWRGPKNPALTDPQDSLELGACYLAYLQRALDDPLAAMAAYNSGPTPVRRWMQEAGGPLRVDDIRYAETKEFVRRVTHWERLFRKVHPHAFAVVMSGS